MSHPILENNKFTWYNLYQKKLRHLKILENRLIGPNMMINSMGPHIALTIYIHEWTGPLHRLNVFNIKPSNLWSLIRWSVRLQILYTGRNHINLSNPTTLIPRWAYSDMRRGLPRAMYAEILMCSNYISPHICTDLYIQLTRARVKVPHTHTYTHAWLQKRPFFLRFSWDSISNEWRFAPIENSFHWTDQILSTN